jgi:hypothetical protein
MTSSPLMIMVDRSITAIATERVVGAVTGPIAP